MACPLGEEPGVEHEESELDQAERVRQSKTLGEARGGASAVQGQVTAGRVSLAQPASVVQAIGQPLLDKLVPSEVQQIVKDIQTPGGLQDVQKLVTPQVVRSGAESGPRGSEGDMPGVVRGALSGPTQSELLRTLMRGSPGQPVRPQAAAGYSSRQAAAAEVATAEMMSQAGNFQQGRQTTGVAVQDLSDYASARQMSSSVAASIVVGTLKLSQMDAMRALPHLQAAKKTQIQRSQGHGVKDNVTKFRPSKARQMGTGDFRQTGNWRFNYLAHLDRAMGDL